MLVEFETTVIFRLDERDDSGLGVQELLDYLNDYTLGTITNIEGINNGYEFTIAG